MPPGRFSEQQIACRKAGSCKVLSEEAVKKQCCLNTLPMLLQGTENACALWQHRARQQGHRQCKVIFKAGTACLPSHTRPGASPGAEGSS